MSDTALTMTPLLQVTGQTMLRFWHQYNVEAFYGGGVVEIETNGGKPKNRKSLFDRWWDFDIATSNRVALLANAWAPASPDGDTFRFTYSINGSDWLPLANIMATFDDGSMLLADMPAFSGLICIRLTDCDRQVGNTNRDNAYVDKLIRTESFSGGRTSSTYIGD